MKLALILVAAITAVYAEPSGKPAAGELTVYVTGDAPVPRLVLIGGEFLASRVFAGIGIRLQWKQGLPPAGVPLERTIRMELKAECRGLKGVTLGTAWPYDGSRAVVCYDHLSWAETHPLLAPKLLGHVLAHEIAHDLQGVERHSASGMMAARWSYNDYGDMVRGPLPFDRTDIELIQIGWQRRVTAGAG